MDEALVILSVKNTWRKCRACHRVRERQSMGTE